MDRLSRDLGLCVLPNLGVGSHGFESPMLMLMLMPSPPLFGWFSPFFCGLSFTILSLQFVISSYGFTVLYSEFLLKNRRFSVRYFVFLMTDGPSGDSSTFECGEKVGSL